MLGSTGPLFLIIVIFNIAVISCVRCMHLLTLIEDDLFLFDILLLIFFVATLKTVTDP